MTAAANGAETDCSGREQSGAARLGDVGHQAVGGGKGVDGGVVGGGQCQSCAVGLLA